MNSLPDVEIRERDRVLLSRLQSLPTPVESNAACVAARQTPDLHQNQFAWPSLTWLVVLHGLTGKKRKEAALAKDVSSPDWL